MRKLTLTLIAIFAIMVSFAQGIDFSSERFADAVERAKAEKKLVFVDIYTTWCGPCKQMADNIFPLKSVGDLYNKNFICLKIDAEQSEDGIEVAKNYGVTNYPTMLFIDGNGKKVYSIIGARDEAGFIAEGKLALKAQKSLPKVLEMRETYEKGGSKVNKAFLKKFITASIEIQADCGDAINSYYKLLKEEEMAFPENLGFAMQMTEYDQEVVAKLLRTLVMSKSSMHPQMYQQFNFLCAGVISKGIDSAIEENNLDKYKEVMVLRDAFVGMEGNQPNIVLGQRFGIVLMPEEFIHLVFFAKNNHAKEFKQIYENYLKSFILSARDSKPQVMAMIEQVEANIQAARKQGAVDQAKQMRQELDGALYEYNVSNMFLSETLTSMLAMYVKMTPEEEKDEVFNKMIVSWYVDLYNTSPSPKKAIHIAEKIVPINGKAMALFVLKDSLEKHANVQGTTPEDLETIRNTISQLESQK